MRPWAVVCLLLSLSSIYGFSVVYQQPEGPQGRKLFGGYRIVPKPCHSRSGQQGICMFNYECKQRAGEVVSACMDGFLFGTCCRLPDGAAFQQPDPDLEIADTLRPPTDNVLHHADDTSHPPRPLPQADTVLMHQNGSVVGDANDPEEMFRPSGPHVSGNHGEGETILVQPGMELSTFSSVDGASPPKWQTSTEDDVRLESVSLVAKPLKTTTTTDGKHTTFYALDTSKHPFPLGTTISRPSVPDATDTNEVDDDKPATKEASSAGPAYYSSRWPSNRPTPGYKPTLVTKYTANPSLYSSSTSQYSDSDDGMVPVSVITHDNDHKRRPPLHEPEPLPEPEPYPESHSESINHILSILNDSSLGVINAGASTQRPDGGSGISTWGLIDGLPPLMWRPHETIWSSTTPSLSTTSYLGSPSKNTTILFTTQHSPGLSTTSSNYMSRPMLHVTGADYTNMTQKPTYSKPAPTVIVLQNIASDYTTRPPSSHYPTSVDNYHDMAVTKRPFMPSHNEDYGDNNTKRPTVHISSTINMYQSSETTKRPTVSIITTKRPAIHISTNAGMYDSTIMNENPTDSIQNMYETSTATRKPTVHVSSTMGNIQSSTSSYRPTVFFSTTAGIPQPTTLVNKKPLSPSTTYFTTINTKKPISISSSTWTQTTMSNTKPLSVNYFTTRPDFISNRPTTVSLKPKPTEIKFPQDLPTTLNYPGEDIVYSTSIADLANFPPVRNPQLNMSMANQQENPWVVQSTDDTPGLPDIVLDNEVSTPPFEEDDKLNIKLHSFVSKIVNSLQQNFLELEDVVLKTGSNFTSTIGTPLSSRPDVTTARPVRVTTSRRPTQNVPGSTTKKPPRLSTSARPVTSTRRPATPSRRPATPQRPRPTANQATVRPRPTLSTTTRRPRPSRRPTTVLSPQLSTTTRRPRPRPTTRRTTTTSSTVAGQQGVSTRPTPTRRSTTRRSTTKRTTTTSTTPLLSNDETTLITEPSTTSSTTTSTPVDYRRECGVRPLMKKQGRIVGGKGATFGAWPWQVLVKETTWLGLFTKNKCGGVLITARYIITAAHCQPGFLANLVAVLGEFDISGELESKRSVTKNVKRVVVHRNYDAATFANDLALLEMESPVSYDTHIVPICMPRDGEDFTGRMATVTGWGRLKYGGGVPTVLQEVQVPIIENSVCQEMFQTAGHAKVILSSFMCAGYANGQRDSCEGDSGGPLMMERDDGRYVLVGTVSHGIKCAAPYLPGVYMRTTYYKPWLRSITGVQ